MRAKNRYPIVFVHGMFGWGDSVGFNKLVPYWGATTGDLTEYLAGKGYESYASSVGPVSSAWDNACELYAQIMGTRVDYGEAHSKTFGHERFGRRYKKPMFENPSKRRIHLVGHSHGGQVIRLLAYLLAYGDEAERNATNEKTISPLFLGGNADAVASVTTLCTPNNGTTLYSLAEKANIIKPLGRGVDFVLGVIGRTPLHGRLVDYQLEQYGLTPLRGEKKADKIITAMNRMRDADDNVLTDLSFKGACGLNGKIDAVEGVNYFCYAACADDEFAPKIRFLPLRPLCKLIERGTLPENQYGIEFDDSWRRNDGLVNTVSAKNPFDEPSKEYDGNIENGVWNVMPEFNGEHGKITGLMADKDETRRFYDNLVAMLVSTEKADN